MSEEQFVTANTAAERETRWRNLLAVVYVNSIYQRNRRRIFERRENVVKVVSLVAASSAFLDLKNFVVSDSLWLNILSRNEGHGFIILASLIILLVNSWGLVFQWGTKARDAAVRADQWTDLEVEMRKIGLVAHGEEDARDWEAKAAELNIGEAATNKHLQYLAELETKRALDLEDIPDPDGSEKGWERFVQRMQKLLLQMPRPFVALN